MGVKGATLSVKAKCQGASISESPATPTATMDGTNCSQQPKRSLCTYNIVSLTIYCLFSRLLVVTRKFRLVLTGTTLVVRVPNQVQRRELGSCRHWNQPRLLIRWNSFGGFLLATDANMSCCYYCLFFICYCCRIYLIFLQSVLINQRMQLLT